MSRTTTGSAPGCDSPYQQSEDPHTRGARLGTGPRDGAALNPYQHIARDSTVPSHAARRAATEVGRHMAAGGHTAGRVLGAR